MINQIRTEFRKLLTIRSTYVILGLCLLATLFFAFFIEGFHRNKAVTDPHALYSEISSALMALSGFFTIVGILLVTHEYRYNTIMYTLTASNSRLKVLIAKFVAVTCFALVAALVFGALSPLFAYVGIHLKGLDMVPQSLPYSDIFWRGLFFTWSYTMFGFIIATLIRSQVGAFVTFFMFPATVEPLLGLLLKENSKYLPYTALGSVLDGETAVKLSHGKAATIVLAYIVVGLLVSALLFRRRDAN